MTSQCILITQSRHVPSKKSTNSPKESPPGHTAKKYIRSIHKIVSSSSHVAMKKDEKKRTEKIRKIKMFWCQMPQQQHNDIPLQLFLLSSATAASSHFHTLIYIMLLLLFLLHTMYTCESIALYLSQSDFFLSHHHLHLPC